MQRCHQQRRCSRISARGQSNSDRVSAASSHKYRRFNSASGLNLIQTQFLFYKTERFNLHFFFTVLSEMVGYVGWPETAGRDAAEGLGSPRSRLDSGGGSDGASDLLPLLVI